MIKINQSSKIYVLAPAGTVTGGTELLHQLVSFLRDHRRDAYMVYFGDKPHEVPSDYRCYNIAHVDDVIDSPENIVVVPEGEFYRISLYKKTQKILWWLSVDNFYALNKTKISPFDYVDYDFTGGYRRLLKSILLFFIGKNRFSSSFSVRELSELDMVNAYQSEYAQGWLLKHNFRNVVPLKDYINIDHCSNVDFSDRDNIVVYNPRKGLLYTQELINATPDLKWVPLQGMTRAQVIQTIRRAKLYVDFGSHPGKDRLPRECAMNGCCIITGRRGSARYFEDVPLDEKYKFDEKTAKVEDIVKTIRWVLSNYEEAIQDYAYYRTCIKMEKDEFESQICRIFNIID